MLGSRENTFGRSFVQQNRNACSLNTLGRWSFFALLLALTIA